MLRAFIDESSRPCDEGYCYVVAAAVAVENEDLVREAMLKLRVPGSAGLHWHEEGAPRRREIIGRMAELDLQAIVVGCRPVAPRRQERNRALLLRTLAMDLAHEGVTDMVIESRQQVQDGKDRSTLSGSQRAGFAPGLVFSHVKKLSEPLLWAADVIAGAVSLHLAGNDSSYFASMETTLLHLRLVDPDP